MRLPSHPCALPAPRFLPRLAVKPAHIAAVQPFCFFQFLCICPQKSVYRGQFHLRISRHRRQISALPVPHKRTQAKGPVLVLNTTDRKLLQGYPSASPQAPPIIAPRNISISVIYPPSIPQNLIPNKNTTKEIRKQFSPFPIYKEGTAKTSVNPKNSQKHC